VPDREGDAWPARTPTVRRPAADLVASASTLMLTATLKGWPSADFGLSPAMPVSVSFITHNSFGWTTCRTIHRVYVGDVSEVTCVCTLP
jgi:hypothetical protein